jgi:Immunoglobulin I-set domain
MHLLDSEGTWFRKKLFKNVLLTFCLISGSVTQPPQATINPRFQEVQEQQLVEFRCAVTGSPVPTIRWTTANGRPLNPSVLN